MAEQHRGLTIAGPKGPRWNGKVNFVPGMLDKPMRWRRPRLVFVNSLSDVFHEGLTNEQIACIFGVMAMSPTHTFQVLTKRPERMRDWFKWAESYGGHVSREAPVGAMLDAMFSTHANWPAMYGEEGEGMVNDICKRWPLPNVWIGVSTENQEMADKRVPILLDVPAAVYWVSYEPALGPVRFRPWLYSIPGHPSRPRLDWIVIGGESGPGARPFDTKWINDVLSEVSEYREDIRTRIFVKQLGSVPLSNGEPLNISDRKGGDMEEWDTSLRVREWPDKAA
jgi:protein gp37